MFKKLWKPAVCLALGAVLISAMSVVKATQGLVSIVSPEHGDQFIVITEDGNPPASLPINVEVETDGFEFGVASVEVALDGVVDGDSWTGTSIVDATEDGDEPGVWDAVVDLSESDGLSSTRSFGAFSEVVIHAFATAHQYYQGRAVATFDERAQATIGVDVVLIDDVDEDGNGMPDADVLDDLAPPGSDTDVIIVTTNEDGTETVTVLESISTGVTRGAALGAELEVVVDLGGGQTVTAAIESPTLEALQSALPGNDDLQDATNGILVVTANTDPANLVENDVDPLSEFAIEGAALPNGVFLRVYILLNVTPEVRGGGGSPTWVSLSDTLPGGSEISMEIFGAPLNGITGGSLYSYDTTFAQVGNDLTYTGDEAGWEAVDGLAANDDADGWEVLISEIGRIFGARAEGVGGGGSSSSCLIASAAYGTPLAGELDTIRALRNSYLMNNAAGQFASDMYYRVSPTLVSVVESHPVLMNVTRIALVPVAAFAGLAVEAPIALMLALAGMVAAVGYRKRKAAHIKA